MYNEIMDAVTKQLSALFPPEAGYTVYTDAVEQGLSEPCFFVQGESRGVAAGYLEKDRAWGSIVSSGTCASHV